MGGGGGGGGGPIYTAIMWFELELKGNMFSEFLYCSYRNHAIASLRFIIV